jgi:hypothetical protein
MPTNGFMTATGESFVAGRLPAAARRALDDLNEGAAWAATEHIPADPPGRG